MADTDPKTKYYQTKTVLLVISFTGIIILAFSLLRSCGEEQSASVAYNKIKDTLQSVLDDTARVYGENRRLRYEAADMDLHVADLVADLNTTKGALIEESDEKRRLAAEVKKAKMNKDTPAYYLHCDSLAKAYDRQNEYMLEVFSQFDQINNARKEQIRNLEKQRDLFERAYDSCKNAVVAAVSELPKLRPAGKWYIDIAAMAGPFGGVGGGITHIDKKETKYTANGMATRYGPAVFGSVGLPIGRKK